MKKIKKLFNYLPKRIFLIIDILVSIEIILISFVNINNLKIKMDLSKFFGHFFIESHS